MSDMKLRQFTTADGQTFYARMSDKDYKEAVKTGQLKKGTSVFYSAKGNVSRESGQLTQNQNYAGTSLERGSEKMESKKDYSARREQYEATLKQQYVDAGMTEKEASKIAKKEAKERIESEKAADEVISAVYFTPDDKKAADFKEKKAKAEAQGKHVVELTDSDMKRLEQFDELKGFVKTDENGKKTIEDQDGLKVAAAKLVGDDNKVSYKERFDLTRKAKDVDGAISHGSARKTKNLFKHLGFDHAHDYTEALIAGGVAAAGAGAAIGAAVVTGGLPAVGALDGGGGLFIPAVAGTGHALTGLAIGSGAGAALAGASQIHDRSKVPEASVEAEPEPSPEPSPEPDPTPAKFRGRAVDEGLKARRNIQEADWKTGTNPMKKADSGQYVLANDDGEVETTGSDYKKPETITFKDNTNDPDKGNINSYTYRLVTDEEAQAGKLSDGTAIQTGGRSGQPLYVLVSADKQDGTDIKSAHAELYELNYEEDGEGENKVGHYDLRQYEGMSGYNVSSNDYSKRGTEGNNGANFKWGNWTRQDAARQNKVKSYNAQSAADLIKHLQPAPNVNDVIKANPSVFDSNGNIKSDAKWNLLDLPKGTVFLD